jgi:peptide/nickel transport system permease protein
MIGYLLYLVKRNPVFLFGYTVAALLIVLILIGDVVAPYDPEGVDASQALAPPSWDHPFGTDSTGMDIFSRVLAAPRVDLSIAITATLLSATLGTPIGVLAGYFADRPGIRSLISEVIMRTRDVIQSFPVFILALAIVAVTGPNIRNVILVLAFLNAPIFLRLTWAQVLALRNSPFIDAARASGATDIGIMRKHLLWNSVNPAIVQLSVTIGFAILLTASLSFVGAGVPVPTPEWGSMVALGAPNIATGQWWPAVFPGAAIGVAVLAFAIIGESLEIALDPRRRS